MKVFLDTNVLIDFMAVRQPHYRIAAALFALAEMGELQLTYSTLSVANSFYILRKNYTSIQISEAFENQKKVAEICGISSADTYAALSARWTDGEDSIQHQAAISARCDFIITRNIQDYVASSIPAMTPEAFLDKYFG